ncbi:MAG: alpha/beta hydrolase [Chloroflexi bacterium]|nr:alpha/beta hydrolase [Chloroflexota bacterium]
MPFAHLTTGASLHYEAVGSTDAPPVIVLHGLLGTARAHLSALLGWLSADYRVYGPSLRGYGQSTPKPRDFPLDFYHRDARDVIAFMDALKIERAHLLGYSDGGEVTLIVGGLAPQRCISLAAWGAVGYFGPAMRPLVQRMYPADWITREEIERSQIPDPNAFVLGWINAVKHMIDSGGDLSVSLAPQISAPVLLMLGAQDTLNPAAHAQRFLDQAPNGRLEMFNTGHAIHDADWPGFQRVVGAFLKAAAGR